MRAAAILLTCLGCGRLSVTPEVALVVDAGREFLVPGGTLEIQITLAATRHPEPGTTYELRATNGLLWTPGGEGSRAQTLEFTGSYQLGPLWLTLAADSPSEGHVILTASHRGGAIPVRGNDRFEIHTDAALPTHVVGEDVLTLDGWRVEVFRDLSADFFYREEAFIDDSDGEPRPANNQPASLILLTAPFEPGLAVIAGRQVLELPAAGGFIEHNYTPSTANEGGPDNLSRGAVADVPDEGPRLVMSANSVLGGDGIYMIDSGWNIDRLTSMNTGGGVVGDPDGLFEGLGSALYYSVQGNDSSPEEYGVHRHGHGVVYAQLMSDLVLAASGDLVGRYDIFGILHAGTYAWEPLWPLSGELVKGAVERPSGFTHVVTGHQLIELYADGGSRVLAESLDDEWNWTGGVQPPAGHSLDTGGQPFYILEDNRTRDIDRILRVTSP